MVAKNTLAPAGNVGAIEYCETTRFNFNCFGPYHVMQQGVHFRHFPS